MAKTNNKGFSLIEIVIAVAILSILLTPIIRQFSNTLNTSRRAKALQEANEKATYQMEEFQTVSREELDKDTYYGKPTEKKDIEAELYSTEGVSLLKTVKYNTYTYTLPDCEIGAKKDKYSNVVVLDDLANKVRAQGNASDPTHYKIAYGLTKTDLEKFGDGFVLTNEGSIVKYTDGAVTAVACTDTTADGDPVSYIADPNDVNLGNMHDLDKDSVAMIMGGTSSFDTEAFSALFSKAMDHLRELDYDSWEQALLNVDSESILSSETLSTSDRLIKIYTDQKTDAQGKDYYVVKVDVYYNYSYSIQVKDLDPAKQDKNRFNDTVSYTIFSQKFYTKEPPEIYFEYQPYCISEKGEAVQYKADDYFLFDNHVDGCRLYLYKPYRDQMNAGADLSQYDSKGEYYTYYTNTSNTTKVKIHFASKTNNVPVSLGADGKPDITNTLDRIYIFTNLDINGYTEYSEATKNLNIQFYSDDYLDKFKYVKGEYETKQGTSDDDTNVVYPKYKLGTEYTINQVDESGVPLPQDSKAVLYTLKQDTRKSDRMYTVTVTLTPLDNNALNTIQLSGARGVN